MKKTTLITAALFTLVGFNIYFNDNQLRAQPISAGNSFSVMLCEDGTVWTCGDNTFGELGDGTTTHTGSNPPGQVSGLPSDIVAVAAGAIWSFALTSGGELWSWGNNTFGQLGTNTNVTKLSPVQVEGGIVDFVTMAGGNWASMALKNDGTVWVWGGAGSAQCPFTVWSPKQIAGLTNVIDIGIGEDHIIVLKDDGTVWTWGENQYGQCGDSTTTVNNSVTQVPGLSNILDIESGGNHSLALKSDGTVWAWGLNTSGQLGDNTTVNKLIPVQVLGLTNVTSIGAGYSHSLAIKNDSTVWAWGNGASGRLGNGSSSNDSLPGQVLGPAGIGFFTAAVTATGGSGGTYIVRNDGTVWAMGYNGTQGSLGVADGMINTSTVPVQMQLSCNVSLTVSTKELSAHNNALAVYPNPTSGKFTLEINMANKTEAGITILNMLGQQVLAKGNYQLMAGKNEIDIDLSNYPAGLYSLVVSSEQGVLTKKVIIK